MNYREYFKEELTDDEILRCFAVVMPYFTRLVTNKCAFTLASKDAAIDYVSSDQVDFNFEYGSKPKSLLKECLDTNSEKVQFVPEEVFGRSLKVIALPIRNSKNEMIGAILNGIDTMKNTSLIKHMDELKNSITEVTENTNQMADSSVCLAEREQSVMKLAEETVRTVSETDTVLELIKNIANQTNLLGLNAAIEAARAGENGKGFSVVATEVRKLANQSKESVSTIKRILDNVNESMNRISKAIEETAAISEEQAASTEEINAAIENITSSIKNLTETSKDVF